jgi:hypothetical protein
VILGAPCSQPPQGAAVSLAAPHPPASHPKPGERVLARTCGHCGGAFEPTRPHQKFCRPSCRLDHFKARLPLLDAPEDDPLCRTPFE